MTDQILKNLNITALNAMQKDSLDGVKKNDELVILSPTGSGKTLAFLLPILNLLNKEKSGIQALIITPSRELSLQIEQVFKQMKTGYKVNCCYGGHSTKTEINNLEEQPAVLIGTPGRLADHIRRGNIYPESVNILVLDEFDKALEFGFQKEMEFIIKQLENLKKKILTSATDIQSIPSFTGINNPYVLNYLTGKLPDRLKLKAVKSDAADKLDTLFKLICQVGDKPTLIFCNHREAVERISDLLFQKGLGHDIFHGGLEQDDRQRALLKFRNGTYNILITTDLASRGLDIPEIENVIHYQLPQNENAFVHRNGRTARMKAEGTSYLILTSDEILPEYINVRPEFEVLPDKSKLPPAPKWSTLFIAAGKKDKINKVDIVGLLLQKGKLNKDDLGLIEVLDKSAYAAVKREKVNSVVQLLKNEKLKKKSIRIEIAR